MFKPANPYDELVAKATDENLTSENWELNLDVCDKVTGQGESGARDCVAAITKRLLHRSANVQLYSLTLSDSLCKNVPANIIYPELSSRAFCQTLTRIVNDRNTHAVVKTKVLSLVKEWSNEMQSSAEADDGNGVGAIMKETYEELKKQNHAFEDQAEESAPPKEPSSEQLRAEDEELRRALEISILDQGGRQAWANKYGADAGAGGSGSGSGAGAGASASSAAAGGSGSRAGGVRLTDDGPARSGSGSAAYASTNGPSGGGSAAPAQQASAAGSEGQQQNGVLAASRVRALYDFVPSEHGELAFSKGDVIRVLDSVYEHWWRGELRGEAGIFPVNYVEILPDPTPADIQRDAELEARIFSSASSIDLLVDKLRELDPRKSNLSEDEELQELYQQALSIRPKIVRLIDRYSAKVAELKGLNEKFVKARGRFEGAMEESLQRWEPSRAGQPDRAYMGHRPQQQQQQQQGAQAAAAGVGGAGIPASLQPGAVSAQPHSPSGGSSIHGADGSWGGYNGQQPQQQQQQYASHQQLQPQQQPYGQHPGGSSTSLGAAAAGGSSSAAAGGSSSASGSVSGAGAGGSNSLPAPPSGGESVPQDDEKRRLFERARAEADAYQNAHRAFIAQQQQAQGQGSQPIAQQAGP